MTIIDLQTIDATETSLDVGLCVIGGGIAGLLVARRIAHAGHKVAVVESGKLHFEAEIHELNALDASLPNYSRGLDGRYRGLGGSSSRWGGRMIPLNASDADDRDHLDLLGWPLDIKSLDVYGPEIEDLFAVANGDFENLRNIPGWSDLADGASMSPRWAKCPSFKRCNLGNALYQELKCSKNLEVWLDATVYQFNLDNESGRLNKADAVNFSGKKLCIRANNFVVAAGTIETTRIMLLIDELSAQRISTKSASLGHYLQDHLKLHVASVDRSNAARTNEIFGYRYVRSTRRDLHLELSTKSQIQANAGSAFAYVAMDLTNSPLAKARKIMHGIQRRKLDLHDVFGLAGETQVIARAAYWRLVRKQLYLPADVDFKIMVCAEQLPHYDNKISLSRECDRLGVRKALLHWQPMESERRTFRAIAAQLSEFWHLQGFAAACPLKWKDGIDDKTDYLSQPLEACAHPSGTTRMGTDRAKSVVDPDLWCHEVRNLAIVSASVFPTAGSANPTFTLMKLAHRFADNYIYPPRPSRSETRLELQFPAGISSTS